MWSGGADGESSKGRWAVERERSRGEGRLVGVGLELELLVRRRIDCGRSVGRSSLGGGRRRWLASLGGFDWYMLILGLL